MTAVTCPHLAAILADPDDDAPRLVYADVLRDVGEWDRAEFIAVQCETAKGWACVCGPTPAGRYVCSACRLRERERELFHRHKAEWFGGDSWAVYYLDCDREDAEGQYPGLTKAIVRRGFIDTITAPLAALLPGPCPACESRGRYFRQTAEQRGTTRVMDSNCPHCVGGTRPGVGAVVKREPVTRVVASCREPYHNGAGYSWFDVGRPRKSPDVPEAAELPGAVFALLGPSDRRYWPFPTADAARKALSVALLAILRGTP